MSDLIPFNGGIENGNSKIPFFKKPGSVTGSVLLTIGGVFALWHINPILTWLNSLLSNMLTCAGLVIALGFIAYCICDKKMRTIISELYFMLVRKLMGIVVDMDPISIVKHHIEKMKARIADIQRNLGQLKGLIKENERHYNSKKEELERNINRANECKNRGDMARAQVYENSVVRDTGFLQRQKIRIEDAHKWYNMLKDLKEKAELIVMDTENEVESRVQEYEIVRKQHKAFTSIVSIINGNDEFKTFTMAMDKMTYDITQRLGEMENIIESTNGFVSTMDIDNAVTSKKATALLECYKRDGIDGLLSGSTNQPKPISIRREIEDVEYITSTNNNNNNTRSNWFDD